MEDVNEHSKSSAEIFSRFNFIRTGMVYRVDYRDPSMNN